MIGVQAVVPDGKPGIDWPGRRYPLRTNDLALDIIYIVRMYVLAVEAQAPGSVGFRTRQGGIFGRGFGSAIPARHKVAPHGLLSYLSGVWMRLRNWHQMATPRLPRTLTPLGPFMRSEPSFRTPIFAGSPRLYADPTES